MQEFGFTCEYNRERKKRGKASRKDIAAQQAAAVNGTSTSGSLKDGQNGGSAQSTTPNQDNLESPTESNTQDLDSNHPGRSDDFQTPGLPPTRSASFAAGSHPVDDSRQMNGINGTPRTMSVGAIPGLSENGTPRPMQGDEQAIGQEMSMSAYGHSNGHDYASMDSYQRAMMHQQSQSERNGYQQPPMMPSDQFNGFSNGPYNMLSPQSQHAGANAFRMPSGDTPLSAGFLVGSPLGGSPGWLSLPSPSNALYAQPPQVVPSSGLRYPVLQPLIPHLNNMIPIPLACDLLDLYFHSPSSSFWQPTSPYVLGLVFRKRSFLRQNNPRPCSPALLASMLWIAAQTSESAFLTSPPSARGRVCQRLLELTVGLLKPLIHSPEVSSPSSAYGANTIINGVALGGFGVAAAEHREETVGRSTGASGTLDDIATYVHLATVVSASEYKSASLRWWNAAWQLARELKLGKELPPNPPPHAANEDPDAEGEADVEMSINGAPESMQNRQQNGTSPQATGTSEEEREERRRIWWLLYTVDRHLALCYNRPLFLLDIECEGLLQPVNDAVWQRGEYYADSAASFADPSSPYFRRRGPSFECTGHNIFGYFTPLMTMLGEIVDLNHARNHPRFGLRFRSSTDWDEQAGEISQQLEAYGRSLAEFSARYMNIADGAEHQSNGGENGHHDIGTPSVHSGHSSNSRTAETKLQTKIVVAYATHLMHTMHILLNGKWDPISLLDDNDLWISSQSFITATGHAVSAAEAISDIIEYDPDISFMPFFFGIYLLQGSFLLLLIADKLQGEASPSVVKACENIVRAHEACVVTLNTEYQVSEVSVDPTQHNPCCASPSNPFLITPKINLPSRTAPYPGHPSNP